MVKDFRRDQTIEALEAECKKLWDEKEMWRENVKSGLRVESARRRNEEQSVVYEQKNEYSKPVSMIKNNETVPEKQDREMKANRYCPKCGAFVNGSTYCGQCGTKVN